MFDFTCGSNVEEIIVDNLYEPNVLCGITVSKCFLICEGDCVEGKLITKKRVYCVICVITCDCNEDYQCYDCKVKEITVLSINYPSVCVEFVCIFEVNFYLRFSGSGVFKGCDSNQICKTIVEEVIIQEGFISLGYVKI